MREHVSQLGGQPPGLESLERAKPLGKGWRHQVPGWIDLVARVEPPSDVTLSVGPKPGTGKPEHSSGALIHRRHNAAEDEALRRNLDHMERVASQVLVACRSRLAVDIPTELRSLKIPGPPEQQGVDLTSIWNVCTVEPSSHPLLQIPGFAAGRRHSGDRQAG
jgi:hypothetical protein